MTSRWGYDLDMSAIRLMRRDGRTWREIAAVKIDGPDIEERLYAMSAHMDDPADPVMLFLPRDQILYMDVAISSEDAAEVEIQRALDGRTPYALDELEIDWEMTSPDEARVAAIALETLDEAAAFAEARGLRIAGYSSLAVRADFPRQPDFGKPNMMDDLDDASEVPVGVYEDVPAPVTEDSEADDHEAAAAVVAEVAADEAADQADVSFVAVEPAGDPENPAEEATVGEADVDAGDTSDEIPADEAAPEPSGEVEAPVAAEGLLDEDASAADVPEADDPPANVEFDNGPPRSDEAEDAGASPVPEPVTSRIILSDDDEDDGEAVEDDASEPVVPHNFTTRRETSRPPSASVSFLPNAGEPVLRVDDSTPVMMVGPRSLPPLDPGVPIGGAKIPPRVRTDIAAGTMRRQVASLTPPAAVTARASRSGSGAVRTLAVLVVAFLLTVGIATLVWSLLPLRPGSAPVPTVPRPVATDMGAATPAEPAQQAVVEQQGDAVPLAEPAPSVAATDPAPLQAPEERPAGLAGGATDAAVGTAETAALSPAPAEDTGPKVDTTAVEAPAPDLPVPVVEAEVTDAPSVAPGETDTVEFAALSRPVTAPAPKLTKLLRSGEGRPRYDPQPPLAVAPDGLSSIMTAAPFPGPDTDDDIAETTNDIYIASIEPSDLALDAIALPAPAGLDGDSIPDVEAAPGPPAEADVAAVSDEAADVLDESLRVAIAAATQEALSEAEAEAEAAQDPEPEAVDDGGLPTLTAFARALPERLPQGRPREFVQEIERQQFNGLTRSELGNRRPPERPESAQDIAAEEQSGEAASALAVATSLSPRGRPGDFETVVSAALVRQEAARLTASLDFETPDTSEAIEAALEQDIEPEPRPQDTPRLAIPSNASVSRTATIEDAIRLNSLNLVGVYGTPADRRALIRLPSGRYVKVKVGDRFDGGTVAQITDTQLHYRKGNNTVSLSLPRG